MKIVLIVLVAAVAANICLLFFSPLSEALIPHLFFYSLLGATLLLLSYLLNRARAHHHPGASLSAAPTAGMRRPCVLAVAFALPLAQGVVTYLLADALGSLPAIELAYYTLLVAAGMVLARGCDARPHVPPLLALLAAAALSIFAFLNFLGGPEVITHYGPDRWFFAMHRLVSTFVVAPLVVAVAFAAWSLFRPPPPLAQRPAAERP